MTNGQALLDSLSGPLAVIRGRMTPDAGMDKVTWFRAGGPAEVLFQPADADDLSAFLKAVPADVSVMAVGIGSNLLVRDGGIPGFVVRLSAKGFGEVEQISDTRLRVGAAVPDKRAAAAALEAGIGGLHFYHGIPGAIGGALRMNAGANGEETANHVVEVHAIDRNGERQVLSREDMGYAYRHSSAAADLIFTGAIFEGPQTPRDEIKAAMDEVQHHRETVQPIREKTGGSTFKNPPGKSAWKLIDEAGCRGLMIGGAQMSPMHCNFMINTGTATGYDLEYLGETVRARVLEHSGTRLEWEIKRVGRFRPGHEIDEFLGQLL